MRLTLHHTVVRLPQLSVHLDGGGGAGGGLGGGGRGGGLGGGLISQRSYQLQAAVSSKCVHWPGVH